jgi:hypothetical protein
MLSHLWGCGCGSRRGTWTHWTQSDLEVRLETVWSSFVNGTESIIQTRLPRSMVVIAVVVVVAVGVRKGKEIEMRGISDLQGNLVNQRRHFDAKSIILGREEQEEDLDETRNHLNPVLINGSTVPIHFGGELGNEFEDFEVEGFVATANSLQRKKRGREGDIIMRCGDGIFLTKRIVRNLGSIPLEIKSWRWILICEIFTKQSNHSQLLSDEERSMPRIMKSTKPISIRREVHPLSMSLVNMLREEKMNSQSRD